MSRPWVEPDRIWQTLPIVEISRRVSADKGKPKKKEDDDDHLGQDLYHVSPHQHGKQTHPLLSPLSPSATSPATRLSFSSSLSDNTVTRPTLRKHLKEWSGTGTGVGGSGGTGGGMVAVIDDESKWTSTFVDDSDLDRSARRSYSGSADSIGWDEWSTPGAGTSRSSSPDRRAADTNETAEVIVHEVQLSDSLEGLAVRYGVKVASIRKANKMWTSDTIHLRKILFVPITPSAKLKSPLSQLGLSPPNSAECQTPNTGLSTPPPTSSSSASSSSSSSSHFRTTRVPKTSLSFFPARPTLLDVPEQDTVSINSLSSSAGTLKPIPSGSSSSRGAIRAGMDVLARLSSDSLPLSTSSRTSQSDDPGEVELDVAAKHWRKKEPRKPIMLRLDASGSQLQPESLVQKTQPTPVKTVQPSSVPPMRIPQSRPQP